MEGGGGGVFTSGWVFRQYFIYLKRRFTTSNSAVSGEVFTKQDLTTQTERQRTSKAVSRPKRKERKSKGGSQTNSQDIMRKIKLSSEVLHASDKENSETITSLISKNRISQKVGLYSKSKSSDTITRRKPLEGLKLTQSAANAAKNDLRRVIGGCATNLLASAPAPNTSSSTDTPSTSRPSPSESLDSNPPLPVVMEVSPPCDPPQPKPLPSVHEAAMRVVEGLKPEHVFRCGNRLRDTKLELRRMIKQQNISLFQMLTQCVHQGQTLTPHIMACSGLPREQLQVPKPSSSSALEPLTGLEFVPTVHSEAAAERTDLSGLFGPPCPPPPPPCNPASAQALGDGNHDSTHLPPHHGSHNHSLLMPHHHGNYYHPQVHVVTGAQAIQSADFLDIVDGTTPPSWLPPVPSPSPDRPKLFPHRLY